ncbi:SIMPL domain-containing protein [Labrys neptuniae]
MLPSLAVRPALAALLLAGALGVAQAEDLKHVIAINGEATVGAKPDVAYVSIGVASAGKVARDVLSANSKATGDVLAALKAAGIEAKDLQTSGFSVQPVSPQNSKFSSSSNADDTPAIAGYTVSNTVNVTLRDLPKLGDVLDKAVNAGANSIEGIQFVVSNQSVLLDGARKAALADARRKAQVYADASGLKLGKLVELSENSGPIGGGLYRAKAMQDSVPIESGESTLNVTVSARFELGD